MRRRVLVESLAVIVMAPSAGLAQRSTGARPRIGYLGMERAAGPHRELDAFLAGMRDLGYDDGRNLTIEYRMAGYNEALLPGFAAELVALRVAAIVAFAPAFTAAMAATREIPIVMRATVDPVKAGYVSSLARRGGNLTGVSSVSGDLYSKRVQLLAELLPDAKRIAILWNPQAPRASDFKDEVAMACARLGLTALPFAVRAAEDLGASISAAALQAAALVPVRSPLIVFNRARIAEAAAMNRLPAIYDEREYVDAGGLISYGANLAALHRRAAYYVDRILRGEIAGELPIEEPTVYELVINLEAAKALGLTIPPTILARADEVIE